MEVIYKMLYKIQNKYNMTGDYDKDCVKRSFILILNNSIGLKVGNTLTVPSVLVLVRIVQFI